MNKWGEATEIVRHNGCNSSFLAHIRLGAPSLAGDRRRALVRHPEARRRRLRRVARRDGARRTRGRSPALRGAIQ